MNLKRTVITLSALLLSLVSFAAPKDTANAVTMVAYEQDWDDSEGTLALKNNTSEVIHSVKFQIDYLDMKGQQMDYKVFTRSIDIDPGMTRKVDIPAYEYDRWFHYYKSKGVPNNGEPFKINFHLKGYNMPTAQDSQVATSPSHDDDVQTDDLDDLEHYTEMMMKGMQWYAIAFMVIPILIAIVVYIGLLVLVSILARQRGRNPAGWVVLSIFITPVLGIIILLIAGNSANGPMP